MKEKHPSYFARASSRSSWAGIDHLQVTVCVCLRPRNFASNGQTGFQGGSHLNSPFCASYSKWMQRRTSMVTPPPARPPGFSSALVTFELEAPGIKDGVPSQTTASSKLWPHSLGRWIWPKSAMSGLCTCERCTCNTRWTMWREGCCSLKPEVTSCLHLH